jgi:hypothetical protein
LKVTGGGFKVTGSGFKVTGGGLKAFEGTKWPDQRPQKGAKRGKIRARNENKGNTS